MVTTSRRPTGQLNRSSLFRRDGRVAIFGLMSGEHPISTVTVTGQELTRLLRQPGFGAALRSAYRGTPPLDDAIYWRQHPLSVAPGGAADPACGIAPLKSRVYARPSEPERTVVSTDSTDSNGAPVLLSESEARLLAIEREVDEDATALDRAIAEAREAIRLHGEALRESSPPPRPPGRFQRLLRRHPVSIFTAAAILLTAIVVPGVAVSTAPAFTPSAGLLKVFARPQNAIDIVPQVFSGGQPGYRQEVRDTTRFLGARHGIRVFVFRDSSGQVCLLATAPGDHAVYVCEPISRFARSGIAITDTDYGVTDATSGTATSTRFTIQWGPDSGLTVRPAA